MTDLEKLGATDDDDQEGVRLAERGLIAIPTASNYMHDFVSVKHSHLFW